MSWWRASWVGKPAPALEGEAWFNVSALPAGARVKAKAATALLWAEDFPNQPGLLYFWDYNCIHCLKVLPQVKQWWQQYRNRGLLVIGVHTPEFEFAKEADKVESALLRFAITFPVVSDPRYITWENYHNQAWPRILLLDRAGIIQYDVTGAGHEEEISLRVADLVAVA